MKSLPIGDLLIWSETRVPGTYCLSAWRSTPEVKQLISFGAIYQGLDFKFSTSQGLEFDTKEKAMEAEELRAFQSYANQWGEE